MAEMYWGWIGTTKVQMRRYGYYNPKGRYLDEILMKSQVRFG